MASSFENYQRRKLISSYVSVVISIALVLFLLGCLGVLLINSKRMADHFKENVAISIFLQDDTKSIEVEELKNSLAMADYTKKAVYVSKEDAAAEMEAEMCATVQRDIRKRQQQEEAEKKETIITDNKEDEDDKDGGPNWSDAPINLGNDIGKIGSAIDDVFFSE